MCNIYGLGVILYELLTGRRPFEGRTVGEVFALVLTQPPFPPSLHRPGLDPALERICLKALEKKPGDRHASMSAFGDALGEWLEDWLTAGVPVASVTSPPRQFTNSLGMTLARIEPGEFLMGSTPAQIDLVMKHFPNANREWFANEMPQHRVRITRPFHLGIHPVTVGQFRRFVETSGYETEAERKNAGAHVWDGKDWNLDPNRNWKNPGFRQGEDHPVTCVSHNDARAFLDWLSSREKGEGRLYRLPSEAEWEYACRAGGEGVYGASDHPSALDRVAWYHENSGGSTHPVGGKDANGFGLFDMLGNVWEWCEDHYDAEFYAKSPRDDPRNTASGGALQRVYRGGGWFYFGVYCRSASREGSDPVYRGIDLGFRVAAVPIQ